MKAVILTGGKGTRLAPYTAVLPKPLLPIGEIPILEIILWQLRHHGFTEVILAGGYLAELIQAYLINNKISQNIKITYHREEEPLGTSGALASLEGLDDSFLVMNGDILTTIDYAKLIKYHKKNKAALTVATTEKNIQISPGVPVIDDENRILGYDEKPVKSFITSTGIHIYEPRALDFIKPDTYLDFPDLVMKLVDAGETVLSCPTKEFWLDMGNKDDYEKAVAEFQTNRSAFLPHDH
jgi:NDP-sugar pyrophosphorylase family protein